MVVAVCSCAVFGHCCFVPVLLLQLLLILSLLWALTGSPDMSFVVWHVVALQLLCLITVLYWNSPMCRTSAPLDKCKLLAVFKISPFCSLSMDCSSKPAVVYNT